ncbi:MAG: FAD-binding oxidoreductase [Peptococcaceae bacterium]|nr:FAD-binding oxidoreductase [Peptococcaceae bacterium]
MKSDIVLKALQDIVGEEWATSDEATLVPYSYDIGGLSTPSRPAGRGEFVVMPQTVEQIQEIIKLANIEKVPVTPIVFGSNMGGVAIPLEGGIVLDLHRMNKIIEVNEVDNYAIVEPGVSMGMFERELRGRGYWFPLPMSPPNASSVVANLLLTGIGHFASKIGCQSDLINGVEVVLPTGELARGGSCAFSEHWHSRYPIPDVIGLFVGWQGMTGVVTKMSVPIFKRPPYQMSTGFGFDDYTEAIMNCMIPFQARDIAHDVSAATWSFHNIQKFKHPMPERPKEDPKMYVYMSLCGFTEEELSFKKKILDDFLNTQKKAGLFTSYKEVPPSPDLTEIIRNIPNPRSFKFSDFKRGGGAWVGSITAASQWPIALPKLDEIMIKYDVPPSTRCTLLKGSNCGMFRCRWGYDSGNWDEIQRILEMSKELLRVILEHGGLMYKAPVWGSDIMLEKAHPGYKLLMQKIKKMLDPNNIMNPGRWGL